MNIKTVTHEGKVYQIDGVYLVSDMASVEDNLWTPIRLSRIDAESSHPFRSSETYCGYRYIKAVQPLSVLGTITPAPEELIDGAAYTFNIEGNEVIGLYDLQDGTLTGGRYCLYPSAVSNIRLMTVESK